MTVSSISPSDVAATSSINSGFQKTIQDFKALASALQSNDLSGAQNALAAFQQDLQNAPANTKARSPFDSNSQLGKDLQAVQTALQSNDLTGAQKAFATLQQDLQSAIQSQGTHKAHHHHRQDNDGDDSATGSSSSASDSATDAASQSSNSILDAQA
jgi:hypothetical protein